MKLKSTFQLYLTMKTSLLNSTLQSFCLDSKSTDFQDSSKCLGFSVNIALHGSSVSKLKIHWPVYRTKIKFLAVQNLTKVNNCKAAVRRTQTDSSSWFPCFVKGIIFLYFCVAPSPPTEAMAPRVIDVAQQNTKVRPALFSSLGGTVSNSPWKPGFREGLELPSYSPLCSQTPEGRRWGAGGNPMKDLQLLSPFWEWWHCAQREVPKSEPAWNVANKAISFKSPLEPICIPHQCLQPEQLTATRTLRPHSDPSNAELNLCF